VKVILTSFFSQQETEMNWMAGKSKVVAVQFWEASASQFYSLMQHLHSPDFPLIEMNGSSIVRGLSNGSLCFWNRWTLQAEQQVSSFKFIYFLQHVFSTYYHFFFFFFFFNFF